MSDKAGDQYHRGFIAGEFVEDSGNNLDDEDRARIECELKCDSFRRGFEAGKRHMRAAYGDVTDEEIAAQSAGRKP